MFYNVVIVGNKPILVCAERMRDFASLLPFVRVTALTIQLRLLSSFILFSFSIIGEEEIFPCVVRAWCAGFLYSRMYYQIIIIGSPGCGVNPGSGKTCAIMRGKTVMKTGLSSLVKKCFATYVSCSMPQCRYARRLNGGGKFLHLCGGTDPRMKQFGRCSYFS